MAIFTRSVTTRGYEADASATIPIPTHLQFLEHLRWHFIQSEEAGLKTHLLEGHFPVVGVQRIELLQRTGMDTELSLHARIILVGRSQVVIEHHVIDEADKSLVAYAQVKGMWLGPNRRLARIPDSFRALGQAHMALEAPEHILREVSGPREATGPLIHTQPDRVVYEPTGLDLKPFVLTEGPDLYTHRFTVRPSDIDIFSHVNAATYVRYCHDARFLAGCEGVLRRLSTRSFRRLAIMHHAEALQGDELEIGIRRLEGLDEGVSYTIRRSRDGQVLCQARAECD
jgi:acyl-CoA thioesterase FadM